MVNKELISYIEECRGMGFSDSKIRNNLLKEGWNEAEILEAMFKYTKPKNPHKKIFIAGFIFAGLLIVLTVGGAIFMLNDIQNTSVEIADLTRDIHTINQAQAANKSFTSSGLGFSVDYPKDILVLDAVNATLTHTLKTFHKLNLKDGTDLGFAEDIKIVFKKDIGDCDNADSVLQGSGTPFQSGAISGLKYELGAGGEGMVLYCAKNENKNIFTIERYFLSEAWSDELSKQQDFIPLLRQDQIVNQILSSFKFIQ